MQRKLWGEYVWGKQSIQQLSTKTGRSHVWIRKQLEQSRLSSGEVSPTATVMVADVTFWGRSYGVCVFRSPTLKRNLWSKEVVTETPAIYAEGYESLKQQGWTFTGVVIDGKRGVAKVFEDIPIQTCQFHQVKIVTKYLTRRPKTEAGQKLREIALCLKDSNEIGFTTLLKSWHTRWESFLSERTPCAGFEPAHWPFTHRKLRSAYRSLRTNVPSFFTYQKYPEMKMPNTTNCLDGMFSQLKNRLNVHRGAKQKFRYKLIQEILKGKD